MKAQLLLMTSWMLILQAQNSVATVNRTKCSDDDNNVKREIQKFYCTAIKIHDNVTTVRNMVKLCSSLMQMDK